MTYRYLAFGIPVLSDIELPALLPLNKNISPERPVTVKLGKVPQTLKTPGIQADYFTYCNAEEMIFTLPKKIKFYISKGENIIIEPIHYDYSRYLLYFYSNCLAAMLLQRNLIPFHVSGVFTQPGKVALFAAPSGTGKSTLAVKLQELGFAPFTDDTAVLFVKDGKCYAQASYPMIRLWENALDKQKMLDIDEKQIIYDGEKDKYGFLFHSQFADTPAEVERIIFMQKDAYPQIQTLKIKSIDAFKALSDNVYRRHWITALQMHTQQFLLISQILQIVPNLLITRPLHHDTFDTLPQIIKKILNNNDN